MGTAKCKIIGKSFIFIISVGIPPVYCQSITASASLSSRVKRHVYLDLLDFVLKSPYDNHLQFAERIALQRDLAMLICKNSFV